MILTFVIQGHDGLLTRADQSPGKHTSSYLHFIISYIRCRDDLVVQPIFQHKNMNFSVVVPSSRLEVGRRDSTINNVLTLIASSE